MANDNIAAKWSALRGIEDNWEKLISDGIDDDLRTYLVHYGQRVEAIADSFNYMKQTKGYGLSLFPGDELFFTNTCLEIGNRFKYEVSHLIYARSKFDYGVWGSGEESGYVGYVAVATDEGTHALGKRDIMICWRGTLLRSERLEDVNINQVPADSVFPNSPAKVHQGFLDMYTGKTSNTDVNPNKEYTQNSAREQVLAAVRIHVDNYAALNESVSITVTGHSSGAALATLNSMDIVSNGYNKPTGSDSTRSIPVTAFVYGCPRVGNEDFLDLFNSLQPDNLHLLSIRNVNDPIPLLPKDEYYDVGTKLEIDVINSQELENQSLFNFLESHQLHAYLYGIASYQGKHQNSELAIPFDISCLNKYKDLLKHTLMVPQRWWANLPKNGMVQNLENGFWEVLYDYIPPVPPPVLHIN